MFEVAILLLLLAAQTALLGLIAARLKASRDLLRRLMLDRSGGIQGLGPSQLPSVQLPTHESVRQSHIRSS